ncbi:MAG: adenylate/guanylate cyclase domain-containing protein [Cyclobacteriaceae bacterium]
MKPHTTKKLFSQIKTIFWITITWTIISVHQFFVGYLSILGFSKDFNYTIPGDVMVYLQQSLIVGVLAGLIGGSGLVFLWERWLRSKPYGIALISIFLSYSIIYLMVAFPTELFFQTNVKGGSILSLQVWKATFSSVFEPDSIFGFVTWLVIVLCTMIVLLVNDKYGPGGFRKFLMGRYFTAQREERVFMFLDLRSSTTIAEKIGEEKYFNFLKDVFKYATPGILKFKGEIYQYVGDEIVISWNLKSGIERANCINCYFEIQSTLNKRKDFFIGKYGEEPIFKAGLHYGHVMAGEIGVVKREIAFSGDVLNTTARIQSKCNELGVDILASKFLIDRLNLTKGMFHPKEMGEMELRGKKELVTLFTV